MTGRMNANLLLIAGLVVAGPGWAQDNPWGTQEPTEPVQSEPGATTDASVPSSTSLEGKIEDIPDTSSMLSLEAQTQEAAEQSALNRELLTVEQSVNNLKEKVFRSKATLKLLRELVIEGATMGSRVSLVHVNKMGGAYMVESVQYFLDGKAIFSRSDPENGLNDLTEIEVHGQALPPGMHTLRVNLVLRGAGMGVFSYLKAYSFKLQSSYTFQVEDAKLTTVRVVAYQKGGPFKSFVDKPDVEYEDKIESLRQE
jgi:hypothetical protein